MAAKVTLKDIAREVGLSPTAVSLVLNDRPCKISEKSRQRIKEVARKKRYIPNQIARSLVTQHSQTLGLVVPNIESRFFSSLARRLEMGCRERGYALFITNSDESATNDSELIRSLITRSVDGLIIVASDEADDDPQLATTLSNLPVPFVMVDRLVEDVACDKVSFNNEQGGYLACSHLLDAGHTRIACIVNPASNTGRERLEGYLRALREYNIEPDPQLLLESAYYIADAYTAAEQLLATDATAVFASSDNIALGLLKRLYEQGLRVPRDYSVVSYDNSIADVLFEPALTAVEQNIDELATAALEVLFERLSEVDKGAFGSPVTHLLTPQLVIKDSVQTLVAH